MNPRPRRCLLKCNAYPVYLIQQKLTLQHMAYPLRHLLGRQLLALPPARHHQRRRRPVRGVKGQGKAHHAVRPAESNVDIGRLRKRAAAVCKRLRDISLPPPFHAPVRQQALRSVQPQCPPLECGVARAYLHARKQVFRPGIRLGRGPCGRRVVCGRAVEHAEIYGGMYAGFPNAPAHRGFVRLAHQQHFSPPLIPESGSPVRPSKTPAATSRRSQGKACRCGPPHTFP